MTRRAELSPAPVRIVGIGAGPAGVMVLERLLANHARDTPQLRLEITLVDPHEPGGGRIWRRNQSPLLKLNTMLRDDAVFTDASCEIDGPIVPGPSLLEWVEAVRGGSIARPDWWDDLLERELQTVTDTSFPTRRLNSAYLAWAYREIVSRAADTATVSWLRDRVIAVEESDAGGGSASAPHRVRLASGEALAADVVLHTIGHNGTEPSSASQVLADFAKRQGLAYVPPAFTADVELDWIKPGTDVIVRGMGLAAVDLVVLLTEGRGGVFERVDAAGNSLAADGTGTLRYRPSGREPVLHLGSRRGVPYRSKVTSELRGDAPRLDYVGAAFHERVAASRVPLDFAAEVWPLIAAELLTGYYRELFTGHPARVRGGWTEFSASLRVILERPDGFASQELAVLIAEHVPEPLDRFDLASFDRPLRFAEGSPASGPWVGAVGNKTTTEPASTPVGSEAHDDAVLQHRVREHITRDLTLRTTPAHSATQGLFMAALYAYMSIAEIAPERWNARSRTRELPRRWLSYFSYLASGPPGHRLEELVALSEAGVVHFLGGDVELVLDETRGAFRASGSAVARLGEATGVSLAAATDQSAGTVRAAAEAPILIDAWLPEAMAARSDNELLRQLVATGQACEVVAADDGFAGSTGQIAVEGDGRLPDASRQFALGAFTATPTGGAFTRPGLNSLSFRSSDRVGRAVLAAAVQLAQDPGFGVARTSDVSPELVHSAGV